MTLFLQFVSEAIQGSLENVCGFRDCFLAEFGSDCVKDFVKKSIDEVSSVGIAIYENLRASCGRVVARSPRIANITTIHELDFPSLTTDFQ